MAAEIQGGTRRRVSKALFAVNQANTIYGLVFVVLAEFPGFESEKWFFKLAAQIRSSDFVTPDKAPDAMIGAVFQEVADNRLPRLLCISLVSIIEVCLEDVAVIELAAGRGLSPEEELMRRAPADYLAGLEELGLAFIAGPHWRSYEILSPQEMS